MTGRRSVVGIVVLCALALCAFGAANASAGGREYMCEENKLAGAEQFSDAHCTVEASGNGGFKHVEIPNGETQAYVVANANTAKGTTAPTPAVLGTTVMGVAVEVECTKVAGEGSLTNSEKGASGTGTINYSGCAVTKPAGKGCVVTEGGFKTTLLAVTTEGLAANEVQLGPKSGTEFTTIPISGCSTSGLNQKYVVTGKFVATAHGATLTTAHENITKQGTLSFGGNKAGVSGAVTVSTPFGLFAFALT